MATKVNVSEAKAGEQGEKLLAAGKAVRMRLWDDEMPNKNKESRSHSYEVVGYVIAGRAELEIGGETVTLGRGDSWHVPANAEHRYVIVEPFTAVEAMAEPKG